MTNTRKLILTAVAAMSLAVLGGVGAVVWARTHRVPHANVSAYESDMMEGLVRALLKDFGVRGAPVCFLSFGPLQTPPSGRFLARFKDCRQPAVCSQSASLAPPIGHFLNKSNGRPGITVQIVGFKEFVAGTYDVVVAMSNLPPGHDHITYRIAQRDGVWAIIKRSDG